MIWKISLKSIFIFFQQVLSSPVNEAGGPCYMCAGANLNVSDTADGLRPDISAETRALYYDISSVSLSTDSGIDSLFPIDSDEVFMDST